MINRMHHIGRLSELKVINPRLILFTVFLAYISLVPYHYLQMRSTEVAGFHVNIVRVLPLGLIGLMCLLTVMSENSRRQWRRMKEINTYVLLFVLTGLMSCFSAVSLELSLSRWIYYSLTGVVIFYLVTGMIFRRKELYCLMTGIVIIGGIVAAYGIAEFMLKHNIFFAGEFSRQNFLYTKLMTGATFLGSEHRIVATLGHPVTLGFCLIVPFIFAIIRAAASYGRFASVLYGAAALLTAGALFLTFSRGSWIAAMAALGILFSKISRRVWLIIMAVLITAGVAGLTSPEVRESLARRDPSGYWKDPASQNRIMSYLTVSKMFEDYPLMGIGVANFRVVRRQYDEFTTAIDGPDNAFLMSLGENGLCGLIAQCLLLWFFFQHGKGGYRNSQDTRSALLFWGLLALLAALGINMLTFDVFHQPVPRIYFWTVAGIIAGMCEILKQDALWNSKCPVTFDSLCELSSPVA